MGVRGTEYSIFSPKSEELIKCIYLVHIPFLCIISMPPLRFLELWRRMLYTFQRMFLLRLSGRYACLSLHHTCQLECTPPGGRFQEASLSSGVPVIQRCWQNWIENNFLISTVKSNCLDSTCYWVQFEDHVENLTVAFMKENRLFPFLMKPFYIYTCQLG